MSRTASRLEKQRENKNGCCDGTCSKETCMSLPVGGSCQTCVHGYRCVQMFGAKHSDTSCQFFPRRFSRITGDTSSSVLRLRSHLAGKLRSYGLFTVGEISERSENYYINSKGLSPESVAEISDAMKAVGFSLASPEPCTDTIYMLQGEFKELSAYNTTIPTGTYIGKRWRCNRLGQRWFMGEYYDVGSPDSVGINWRPIVVVDSESVCRELLSLLCNLGRGI